MTSKCHNIVKGKRKYKLKFFPLCFSFTRDSHFCAHFEWQITHAGRFQGKGFSYFSCHLLSAINKAWISILQRYNLTSLYLETKAELRTMFISLILTMA